MSYVGQIEKRYKNYQVSYRTNNFPKYPKLVLQGYTYYDKEALKRIYSLVVLKVGSV